MSEFYQSLSHSKWDCKYHVVVTVPSVAVVGAKKEAHFPSVLPNRRE
jgi:hypothetical protein